MGRLYTEPPSPARQEHEDECCKKVNKIRYPVLGHSAESAKAVSRHCKKVNDFNMDVSSTIPSPKYIPESDVYRLVMRSMPESGRPFLSGKDVEAGAAECIKVEM